MAVANKVLEEALTLPTQERARLAAELIASLDEGEDADVEQAWAVEIQRRAEELRSGKVEAVSWEEVRERLLRRLARS
ncbi:MAG: addiction module protein [Deltaproteobacteria bacterium]|nr:addiction module protein [Deltaproteobacteria bacterium]